MDARQKGRGMTDHEIACTGVHVTEFGKYRWRVNPEHVGRVLWAVHKRRLRESSARVA